MSKKTFEVLDGGGFASIDYSKHPACKNAEKIFAQMNENYDSGSRGRYYNEIAFNWPEEWHDVGGIGCFHEEKTVNSIKNFTTGRQLLEKAMGEEYSQFMLDLVGEIKDFCIEYHPDEQNRKLRLGRVMLRQMDDNERTLHHTSEWHEDRGYDDRPFLQYLSAIITLYGKPTIAKTYEPRTGELLLFNNYHRRKDRKLPSEKAFIHRGPESGPKLFLFLEFLIPKN